MVAPRTKRLAASRRRADEEGEDEEGSVAAGMDDDSMSETSVISDADEDADAEGSEVSDSHVRQSPAVSAKPIVNGEKSTALEERQPADSAPKTPSFAAMTSDTVAMMNGLRIDENTEEAEEIHFDDLTTASQAYVDGPAPTQVAAVIPPTSNMVEKRRQEHEEYKRRRDADPAFVPNRGGFFMHDHRSVAPGQNGFRPFGKGRGRARGAFGGPSSIATQQSPAAGPADAPWAHDLHETVAKPDNNPTAIQNRQSNQGVQALSMSLPSMPHPQPPNRSFSRTTRIGKVQIRVFLSSMAEPIIIPAVPVNQHTRLPHHRPPLRRDKPVRVSIPDMPIRYIFPSTDRSFIFIPRALRPNQQGFGRARARGSFSIGYGPLSSRRTSAYAGSAYSPSVALSRRSSLAREMAAEGIVSPSGLSLPRPAELSKPVVRLPPAGQLASVVGGQETGYVQALPTVSLPQMPAYPPPENPTYRENRPVPIPMHQPKPQKQVSVNDIESPATFSFNPPQQQDQQPFHQQVPAQVGNQAYQHDPALYTHSRHPSHPSQASGGTPSSQMPERAAHAHPFQPYGYQQPLPFYPQQYAPTLYYYPSEDPMQATGPSVMAPAFIPGQPYPFVMSLAPGPAPAPAPAPQATESTTQAGTVAHESNGMVYYYDSSQLNTTGDGHAAYTSTAYAMTPPLQYYPQPSPTVYYPAQ
ncbi:MAG: hypothetical protein Q9208_001809 [Pyrenodesmia sp. 3 TL-2023]